MNTMAFSSTSVALPARIEKFSSSLTLYSRGQTTSKTANATRLLDKRPSARVTTGSSDQAIEKSNAKQRDLKQQEKGDSRTPRRYVTCLKTSLSTTWKRSLSQDSDERERGAEKVEVDTDQAEITEKTTTRANQTLMNNAATNWESSKGGNDKENKPENHKALEEHLNIDAVHFLKEKVRNTQEKRLKQNHVLVQSEVGKQVSIVRPGHTCQQEMDNKKPCTSYVYIKGKYSGTSGLNTKPSKSSTVRVQKPQLYRSISISEGSLSDAKSRKKPNQQMRCNSVEEPGIVVQRKPAIRSITLTGNSMDQMDGKMGTIYESEMEEPCGNE
ncbi:predicted protein [Nematostella vectensis]|uniref:Uncharacterized protein n=1 Tax=Nematostella vectensis TaxID=45351 RepID=A7RK61_NEMVE|nr:predicted protein [Nematostella vectensis]|eukprot:XP_001640175.1 predicted protein [Nematostella vectensis]